MIFLKLMKQAWIKDPFHIYENEDLNCIISFHKRGHRKPNNLPSNYLQIYFQVCILLPMIFKEWRLPTVYSKTVIFRLYIDKSMLHRVKFVNCKLTGTKLMESYIGNTLFENCKMDYVNLSGSNIKKVPLSTLSYQAQIL